MMGKREHVPMNENKLAAEELVKNVLLDLVKVANDHGVTIKQISERPPAKAGGFRLRLKAGLIGHPAD
ncbi:MAG: hypothetical protein Tsb002_37990 [Wenzhouxiangellaceae bacterium]